MTPAQGAEREQCHAWCSCTGSHWLSESGHEAWRPGADDCSHPPHDEAGVSYWGISAVALYDEVALRLSGGLDWFWGVVRDGALAEHGWAASARAAVADAERVVTGRVSQRCELVAAEGWRRLADRDRWGVEPDAA